MASDSRCPHPCPLPQAGEGAKRGPLSRLRERVGVRVFAGRKSCFVSHEPAAAQGALRAGLAGSDAAHCVSASSAGRAALAFGWLMTATTT